MKRDGGSGWVVLLVAAFGIALAPVGGAKRVESAEKSSADPPPAASASSSSASASRSTSPHWSTPLAKPLTSLAKALWEAAELDEEWAPLRCLPGSAIEADVVQELRERQVRISPIVVSVPDPDKGMALYYDQAIDALRRGAASLELSQRGFSLRKANETSRDPDYIVFRGDVDEHPWLVVALFARESPVLGPDREALARAIDIAAVMSTPRAPEEPTERLAVLGPYFSGSAGPLGAALRAGKRRATVVTGSATAEEVGSRLSQKDPDIKFQRTVLSESLVMRHLLRRIDELHQGRSANDETRTDDRGRGSGESSPVPRGDPVVATLSEFDTVFGTSVDNDAELDDGPRRQMIRVSFPSSIAQLRREKLKQTSKTEDENPLSLRRTLELNVAPSDERDPDTPHPISDVTPFSQELELSEELRRLCRLRVDYLILRATDPLDILFLADQVKGYCPRISLVLIGAEAIYRHPDLFGALSGALVVGEYPLLFDAPDWSSPQEKFAFGSRIAQGVYNAWVTLVSEARGEMSRASYRPPLLGFAPLELVQPKPAALDPIESLHLKPIWITKLRAGSFWPVDVALKPARDAVLDSPDHSLGRVKRASGFAQAIGFPILVMASLIIAGGLGARYRQWSLPLAQLFMRIPGKLGVLQCRYAFAGCLSMSVFLMIHTPSSEHLFHAASSWKFYYGFGHVLGVFAAAVLAVFASLFGCRLFREIWSTHADKSEMTAALREALSILALILGITLTLWGSFYTAHVIQLGVIEKKMVMTRMLEPVGMSPMMPLVYLALGFCLWSWVGLTRVRAMRQLTLFDPLSLGIQKQETGRGPFTRAASPPGAAPGIAPDSTDVLGGGLLERTFTGRLKIYEMLACFVLLPLGAYFFFRVRPTWEGAEFDGLFRIAYAVLYGLVVVSLIHSAALAVGFSAFLRQLAALPMIEAYDRIAIKMTSSFGTQIGMRVPSFSELRVSHYSARLLTSLAKARARASEGGAVHRSEDQSESELHQEEDPESSPAAVPKTYRDIFARAGEDLELCAQRIEWAFRIDSELEPAQARGHAAFYQTSQVLSRFLHELWDLRVEQPEAAAVSRALDSKDLLIGGSRSNVPMVAFYQAALPEDVLHWIRMAEDFVALRVATFAAHVILHLRMLLCFSVGGSLLLILAGSHYPFEPSPFVAAFGWGLAALVLLAGLVLIIRMEQNEILSRLGGSRPGKLDFSLSFLGRLFVYVGLPILAVAANSFPGLRDALFALLRPFAQFLP